MAGTDEYRDIVLRARRQAITEMPIAAQQALADTYARQLVEVIEELDRLPAGSRAAERAERLMRELSRALNGFGARANVQISGLSEDAVRRAIQAHQQALAALNTAEGLSLGAAFGRIPERAMQALYVRRGLGVVNSFKTLNRFSMQASAAEIEAALADAIAKGETYREATEKIARALVQGDPELEAALERHGLRGGLRAGQTGPIDEAVAQTVRTIGYNARRIAITEINTAYWESDRLSYAESPVVQAVAWVLSASHPRVDICDVFADEDVHGLGGGIYYAQTAPSPPHPFCLCSLSPVFRPAREWSRPKPEPSAPQPVNREAVRRRLGEQATEREVERTTQLFNAQTRKAHSFWKEAP